MVYDMAVWVILFRNQWLAQIPAGFAVPVSTRPEWLSGGANFWI